MSTIIRNTAEANLATRVYKLALEETYGIHAGSQDLWKLKNIRMILDVLTWNDTNDYLTESEEECLLSKLRLPYRNCNC